MGNTKRIFFLIIFELVLISLFVAESICIYIYLQSLNEIKFSDGKRIIVRNLENISLLATRGILLGYVVLLLHNQVIYTILVSISTFYFTASKEHEGVAEVQLGYKWSWGSNLGSIVYWTAIDPFINFVKLFWTNKSSVNSNCFQKAQRSCIMCFCGCFDGIIDFVGILAIANLSISGENFSWAGQIGLMMNLRYQEKFYFAQNAI